MDYRKNLCIFFIIVLVIPHPVFPAPLGVNGHPSGDQQGQEIHHRQKRGFWAIFASIATIFGGSTGGGIAISKVVEENKRSCTRHDGRCRTSCSNGWYQDDYYNASCNGLICCKNEELEEQKREEHREWLRGISKFQNSFGYGVNFGG